MNCKRRHCQTAVASFLALQAASSVWAQTPTDVGRTTNTLEEIIVTATRREENLQEIPESISAVTAEKLEELRARSQEDYVYSVPGITFTRNERGRDTFVIRGIAPVAGPTVALYIDETPMSVDLRLFDIERVEILRGPQGTIFGQGTMGGAMRTITRRPVLNQYEMRIDSSVSTTDGGSVGYDVNAAVNLPVVQDKFALRLVGYRERVAGFIDNYSPVYTSVPGVTTVGPLQNRDTGEQTITGGRLAAQWRPIDDLTVDSTFYYQKRAEDGTGSEDTSLGKGSFRQSMEIPGSVREELLQWNLTLNYAFSFADLISSTSLYRLNELTEGDGYKGQAGSLQAYTNFLGDGRSTASVHPIFGGNDFHTESLTQEVRLTSSGKGRFNWLLGGYYNSRHQFGRQSFSAIGISQFFPAGFTPNDEIFHFLPDRDLTDLSFFGELGAEITERWGLTVGMRRYRLTNEYDQSQGGLLNFNFRSISSIFGTADRGDSEESGATYKIQTYYKLTPDHFVYAQASSGYRPGGPNAAVPSATPIPTEFESDKLWQYEAGLKTSWFDNRLTANVAGFHINWTEVQTSIVLPEGFGYMTNAGSAETEGAELELHARPWMGLNLGGAFTWTDTEFKTAFPLLGIRVGDPIPNIPKYQASANAMYDWQVAGEWSAFASGNYTYVGERVSNANLKLALPGYKKVDLRLGVKHRNQEVALFVTNLTNEAPILGRLRFPGGLGERVQYLQPRTIGVSWKADF